MLQNKKRIVSLILMLTLMITSLAIVSIGASAAGEEITTTYTFSNYTAGTQYADNEEHELDENVTVITTDCHFTTQLRIYSSSTYDGYAIIESANPITAISVNAGNKADTLNVYGSNDEGATWTLIGTISVTSTSYNDYTLDFGDNSYKYLKLDVAGNNQIRIATMTLTTIETSGGGSTEPDEPEHTHSYTESVTTEATCTTAGLKTFTCSCGDSYTEEIATTGHNYVDGACSVCGEKETQSSVTESTVTVNIAGNTGTLASDSSSISWTSDSVTVTNLKGSTAIRTSDSGHYRLYSGSTLTVSASEGKITKIVITCTSSSYATVMQTSATNAGYTATVSGSVVTVTGFNAESVTITLSAQVRASAVEVTVEVPNGDSSCTHSYDAGVVTAPTCTEAGYTTYTCTLCEHSYKDNEVAATGHSYTDHVCTVCGADDPDHYFVMTIPEAVAAADGKKVQVSGTVCAINTAWSDSYGNISVTITDADGNELYLYRLATNVALGDIITVQGAMATYSGNRQIAAGATATIDGHDDSYDYTEMTIEEALAAADNTSVIVTGTVISIDTEYSESYGNISVTIADANGNTLYLYRLNGNVALHENITVKGAMATYNESRQIAGGTFTSNGVEECSEYSDATCTEPAKCVICGATKGDSLGHNIVVDEAVAPTCTETGLTAGEHCTRCDYKVAQEVVPATGHSYNEVVTAPTCTAAGYTTYTCACGDSYTVAGEAATGHSYNEVVTAPTFDAEGYTTYTCACGDSYVDNYVAALVAVAQIGETKYESLQAALDAAQNGDTITLLDNIVVSEYLDIYTANNGEVARNFTLDLNGHTISPAEGYNYNTGYPLVFVGINQTLTIKGEGTITAEKMVTVGVYGTLYLEGGTIVNNGTTDEDAALDIYYWNNDLPSYEGIVGGTGVINGGHIDGVVYVDPADEQGSASLTINGGTFTTDVSGYCTDGYVTLPDLNGNYILGKKPSATVNDLGASSVPAGEYGVWNGSSYSSTSTEDMPLSFVMQFLADQSAADMADSPYADWYGDFVITFTGIEGGSFVADGCYLAGHYGEFGWVKVPVDGMTIEEGARYPVMLGVGLGQKYDYICSSVQDFRCALYLTPEILAANPNIKVTLELAVVDNSKGSDAAANALVNNENVYSVVDYDYVAEDFVIDDGSVVEIGGTKYMSLEDALAAAISGDVIRLKKDVTYNGIISFNTNVVIDLNGHVLTADALLIFAGQGGIIDSAETKGLLAVPQGRIMANQNSESSMLPVWNEDGTGYILVEVTDQAKDVVIVDEDSFSLEFRPGYDISNAERIALFGNGGLNNDISFFIRINFIKDGAVAQSLELQISDELVASVYGNNKAFKITVNGASAAYDSYDVISIVKSNTGLSHSGSVGTFTPAKSSDEE